MTSIFLARRASTILGRVLEVADGDGVVPAVGEALVAVVPDEYGLLALLVGLQAVRPGAVTLPSSRRDFAGYSVGVHDRHGGRGEHEREGGVGLVQVEDDLAVALRLDPVEAAEQTGGAAVDVDRPDPVDGVLDGLGVQRVAVGELQALAQLAAVDAFDVRERAALGGVGLGLGRTGADSSAASGRRCGTAPTSRPRRPPGPACWAHWSSPPRSASRRRSAAEEKTPHPATRDMDATAANCRRPRFRLNTRTLLDLPYQGSADHTAVPRRVIQLPGRPLDQHVRTTSSDV